MHWLKKPRNSIEESEALYKRVLEFFWRKPEQDFVVRMSDRPMNEWEIIPTPTIEKMYEARASVMDNPYGFVGFQHVEDGYYEYHFCDEVIVKGENLDTRELLCFSILDFFEMDLRAVVGEFKSLKKGLQGS
jgi:hypothetical protein